MNEVDDLKICDKQRFETEEDAQATANHIMSEDFYFSTKLRIYKCQTCYSWHLTSQEKR